MSRNTKRARALDPGISRNAAAVLRLAVNLAGFDLAEIQRRMRQHPASRRVNIRTVGRWLDEMNDAARTSKRA